MNETIMKIEQLLKDSNLEWQLVYNSKNDVWTIMVENVVNSDAE